MEISKFNIVPNKVAAAYLRGKVAVSPGAFGRLPDALRGRAFTAAGIEDMNTLARIRDMIAKLPEGGDWKKIRGEIAQEIAGDDEQGRGHLARAQLILRVNGLAAYGAARYADQVASAEDFPYWMYVCNLDGHERNSHRSLNGKVFPWDDPFWETHYPPWDWGCRCYVIKLTERMALKRGIDSSMRVSAAPADGFRFDVKGLGIDLGKIIAGLAPEDRDFAREIFKGTQIPFGDYTQSVLDFNAPADMTADNAFVPAKTIGEVEKFINDNIADTITIPKAFDDVALANKVIGRLHGNMKKFGIEKFLNFELNKTIDNIGWIYSTWRMKALTPVHQKFGASIKKLTDIKAVHERNVKNLIAAGRTRYLAIPNDATPDECIRRVVDHETGHAVFNQSGYSAKKTRLVSAFKRARKNGDVNLISGRANLNSDEFFAEAFSMYANGDKLPEYINVLIKEVCDAMGV